MKVSSKPVSSPGRTEKFPPPLMRFLRSNVSSRSRGRSRSSPMFVRKWNNNAAAAPIDTQEPSSPKVTCIGQVRVRRSSKNCGSKSRRARSSKAPEMQRRRCCWRIFRRTPLCDARRLRPKSFRPVWRKWVLFFRFGHGKKADFGANSSKFESSRRSQYEEDKDEKPGDEQNDNGAETEHFNVVSQPSEPPKNALILTRCRSAPYRSSSLASRFWGSPSETAGNGEGEAEMGSEQERRLERPHMENESNERNSSTEVRNDSENEEKFGACDECEDPINARSSDIDNFQGLRLIETGSSGPLSLTRCKSEPARTGERLNPEASLWRQTRRLGFGEPCSLLPPHSSINFTLM